MFSPVHLLIAGHEFNKQSTSLCYRSGSIYQYVIFMQFHLQQIFDVSQFKQLCLSMYSIGCSPMYCSFEMLENVYCVDSVLSGIFIPAGFSSPAKSAAEINLLPLTACQAYSIPIWEV